MIIDTNVTATLHKLRNVEHVGFGEESVENVKVHAAILPAASDDWDRYEAAVENESTMFKHSPESLETKDIAVCDSDRDKYWREMLHRLNFQPSDVEEDVRRAAEFLLHIMHTYGKVTESNLFAETIAIRKVLLAFKSPEALAAIALIDGFDKLVAALEALNVKLHGLYDKRYLEQESIKDLGKLSDYRKVVDALFITFLESVNADERVNERGAKDPAIANAAEQIRKKITALLAQLQKILARRGKKGSGKKDPDINNPENPGDGGDDNGGDDNNGEDGGDDNNGEGGDGNDGDTHNPDTTNPPIPPFIPDFE